MAKKIDVREPVWKGRNGVRGGKTNGLCRGSYNKVWNEGPDGKHRTHQIRAR